jgi:hypothetical protein
VHYLFQHPRGGTRYFELFLQELAHVVRHDPVVVLGVPQTLLVDAGRSSRAGSVFPWQHYAEGFFLVAWFDADLDLEAPLVDFALAVQFLLLAEQRRLLLVVLLLALELLHSLDHVQLVEALVVSQSRFSGRRFWLGSGVRG